MSEIENDKKTQLPLPNNCKEFYPKNYSKKEPNIKERKPLEKDSKSFYPKSKNKKIKEKIQKLVTMYQKMIIQVLHLKMIINKIKKNKIPKRKRIIVFLKIMVIIIKQNGKLKCVIIGKCMAHANSEIHVLLHMDQKN